MPARTVLGRFSVSAPIDAPMRELTRAGRAWLRAAVDNARRRAEAGRSEQGRRYPIPVAEMPPRPAAVFEHERRDDQEEADHA
jgi:hypothetical protein